LILFGNTFFQLRIFDEQFIVNLNFCKVNDCIVQ
jgi:hypothetical protein